MSETRAGGSGATPAGWLAWFCILASAIVSFVGLRYVVEYRLPSTPAGIAFPFVATVGHLSAVTIMVLAIAWLPCRLLPPLRSMARPLTILAAASWLTLLVMDSIVFAQHRFHIDPFTAALFDASTWALGAVLLLVFSALSVVLSANARRLAVTRSAATRRVLIAVPFILLLLGHVMHAWADARYDGRVTAYARYLPFYYPLTAKRYLARAGWVDPETARKARLARKVGDGDGGELSYPLEPLQCVADPARRNVLIILLDGLRFDSITADQMPFLSEYASGSLQFLTHYSGGNSSRMGLFSLLYGLPSSYFDAFYNIQRPSVLTEAMLENGYEFSVIAGYTLRSPAHLDRTAFAEVAGLAQFEDHENENDASRDLRAVEAWEDYLRDRRSDAPLFGYLQLDLPTLNVPTSFPMPAGLSPDDLDRLESDRQAFHRLEYLRRIYFADHLVTRALEGLAGAGLSEDTVVVVTGDHGQEFDDSGQDLWFHGSGFTDFQVRTPMIIHWPGREPRTFFHRTSHYDFVPTLMQEIFGCEGPAGAYSVGSNLFGEQDWNYLILGSYYNRAVLTPDYVMVSYPGAVFELRDRGYRLLDDVDLDGDLLRRALADMSRFYR
ncbi:MAG: DUF3413 domain-containing protein [Chromatiales bacterium]|nr:DUF3413 domain-containing protein [Chromatiales bacterium]